MKPLIMKNMSTPTAPPAEQVRAKGFLCVDVVKHKSEVEQDNDQSGYAAQVLDSVEHFFPFCKCADQPRMIPAVVACVATCVLAIGGMGESWGNQSPKQRLMNMKQDAQMVHGFRLSWL
ncbi:hypothetical protein FA071_04220 [Pseudomonas aeruginosa]|nr:hypothetical protein [Pseudomonas aeruginosa]